MILSQHPGKIKVLHIYRTYFPDTQGGGEEVIRQVCLNTRALNVESRVFSLSPDPAAEPLQREEAEVFQVKRHLEIASCGISFSALTTFREQAAWADVLHYHFPWPFGDVLHLSQARVTGKPTVISYHSDVVRQKTLYFFYKPLMRQFLKRVDRIVATSPNYAASSPLLQHYSNKVTVIPIGIDEAGYPAASAAECEAMTRRFGDNFLLFVGVLRYYKGLHILLEAARKVHTPIVIAGAGPMESSLKRFAGEHGLSHVHFAGHISDRDKSALLSTCRGLVFPSHLPSESFGVTLLEASLHGKPMITCEIGTGTTYVNRQGETGLVVAPDDPDALAAAMAQLSADKNLAERLGAGARRRYELIFTGQRMGQQYAALYRQLLEE
jgi:rhamnosyl/mannosyltransferase